MYIGSSQNIRKRWREHRTDLERKTHHSQALQRAWDKYNGDLKFELALVCLPVDLITYEQLFLDLYKPRYNCSPTAGSILGMKFSDETRAKMSKSHMGLPVSEESRKKISLSKIGKPRPPHVIEAVRKARLGKKLSAQQIAFLKTRSGENHPCWGKKLSQETKDRISKANKGQKRTPEQIEVIRLNATGRTHSPESIEKMKEARRQYWVRKKNIAI